MKITFEGTYAEIKQEMQEFLAGAATPVKDERKSVEEEKKEPERKSAPAKEEPVVVDEPDTDSMSVQSVREYPVRTRAEVRSMLGSKISKGEETRTKVKELLIELGGTNDLKDVPDEKLGELYARAEAL